MAEEEPLYKCGMRPFEFSAIKYEIPHMIVALALGVGLAFLNYFIIVKFSLIERYPSTPMVSMVIIALVGSVVVLFAASYYPRWVFVKPDRVGLRMFFINREIKRDNIETIEILRPGEARKTFFSLHYINLSPAVEGAVKIERNKGRAWIFSPEEPEEFVEAALAMMEGRDITPARENESDDGSPEDSDLEDE